MTNARTYRFYTDHEFQTHSGTFCETTDRGVSQETHPTNLQRGLEPLGILDQKVTLDNVKPLIDMYTSWWEKVEKSWSHYEEEKRKGSHLVSLHWILSRIFLDPDVDPQVLRYVVETSPNNWISVVNNPRVPETLLLDVLSVDPKKDPTRNTNGGEIGCFILQNKEVSGKVVDVISRKTKKTKTQRDCVKHPNVLRETLVFLSREGRSETVKRDALSVLVKRGWVSVK